MLKFIYENSLGQSIKLFSSPYRVSNFDGFGDVDSGVQTFSTPFEDGEVFLDTKMAGRPMSIDLRITGKNEADLIKNRRRLTSVINPKLGLGILKVIDAAGERLIKAVPENVPELIGGHGNHGPTFQKAVVQLIAPSPYWMSPLIDEEPAFEPKFHFPFSKPFIMGLQRDRRIIDNDGDAPTPIQVEFFGPATNPRIVNVTTGEYLKINQTLLEGEYMKIDTTPGNKSVHFISEDGSERDVFNWIELGSSFFKLIVGMNDIAYEADSNIQGTVVNIKYHKLYNSL